MTNAGPHASLLTAEFPSAFSRFLDSHTSLHQKSLVAIQYELTSVLYGPL